ncbi:MAG: c-type cytochrome [Myxococcales bacterium]|nr:c-type cytochrome [Myxococcales bacterium]
MRRLLAACGALLLLTGCADAAWPASMEDQPSVSPQEGPRPPPPGSVPEGGVELVSDRTDTEEVANPHAGDPESAGRGEHLFARHCAVCHGAKGEGDGKFVKHYKTPNLRKQSICDQTDGFIYGTITAGGPAMPPLREGTTSRDRWDVVAYVRKIQSAGCIAKAGAGGTGGGSR